MLLLMPIFQAFSFRKDPPQIAVHIYLPACMSHAHPIILECLIIFSDETTANFFVILHFSSQERQIYTKFKIMTALKQE